MAESTARAVAAYEAFVCYNKQDRADVIKLVATLRTEFGPRVFFDDSDVVGGELWRSTIRSALAAAKTCLIFIGKNGWGPFQLKEEAMPALERSRSDANFRVIPVLLRDAQESALLEAPDVFEERQWIDFRLEKDDLITIRRLQNAIKGLTTPELAKPELTTMRIRFDALRWEESNRARGILYSGAQLQQALVLQDQHPEELNEAAVAFLSASRRWRHLLMWIVISALLITLGVIFYFWRNAVADRDLAIRKTKETKAALEREQAALGEQKRQTERAERETNIARAEQLTVDAGLNLAIHPEAVLPTAGIAAEALRLFTNLQLPSRDADERARQVLRLLPQLEFEIKRAKPLEDAGGAVSFSPDGELLALYDNGIVVYGRSHSWHKLRSLPLESPPSFLRFSANARFLAAGCTGFVGVYDLKAGGKPARIAEEGSAEAEFSGNEDLLALRLGLRVALYQLTGSGWNRVPLKVNGFVKPPGMRINEAPYSIRTLSIHADGRFLAFADGYGLNLLAATSGWDRIARAQLTGIQQGKQMIPSAVRFSADARYFAAGGVISGYDKGVIGVWDLFDDWRQVAYIEDYTPVITDLSFSADSKTIGAATPFGPHFWDINSGRRLNPAGSGDSNTIRFAGRAPFALSLFRQSTGGNYNVARVIDTQIWQEAARIGSSGRSFDADLSTDGRQLVTSVPSHVSIWDLGRRNEVGWLGAIGQISSISFDPTSDERAAVISAAKALWVRDPERGWLEVVPDGAINAAFTRDGTMLVFTRGVSDGDGLFVQDQSGIRQVGPLYGHRLHVLTVSPDGKWAGTGDEWTSLDTGEKFPFSGRDTLALSPDGRLAAIQTPGAIRLYNIAGLHGRAPVALPVPLTTQRHVWWALFSPDSRRLYSRSEPQLKIGDPERQQIQIFEDHSADWKELGRIDVSGMVYGLSVTSDGHFIGTSNFNRDIQIWPLHAGANTKPETSWNGPHVDSLAFSPDARYLAGSGDSGYSDPNTHIWDWRTHREVATVAQIVNSGETQVTFSPLGRYVVTIHDPHYDHPIAQVNLWRPEDLIAEINARLTLPHQPSPGLRDELWPQVLPDYGLKITNGETFKAGVVAPGEAISVFWRRPGMQPPAQADLNAPLPFVLGAVQLFFDDQPAPLLYTSIFQINALVPVGIGGRSNVKVRAKVNDTIIGPVPQPIGKAAPVLARSKRGKDDPRILFQGNEVGAAKLSRGETYTIQATGVGAASDIRVRLGKIHVSPERIDKQPGAPGYLAITFTVPTGGPTGNAELALEANGATSSPYVVTIH